MLRCLDRPQLRRLRRPDELQAFLASVRDDRLAAVWRLAAATGFRRGELLGLEWDDVDLDAGTVRVRQATVKVNGGTVTGAPKTPRSRRTIGLDVGTVTALRRWKLVGQNAERLACRGTYTDSGRVVTMPDGRPVPPQRFYRWFLRAVEQAGLRPIRLHDLRHTYVTIANATGTAIDVISLRVGHANTSITANTYAHVLPQKDRDAADAIGSVLDAVALR